MMGNLSPKDLQSVTPGSLNNRRDFLKTTGTIAGLSAAGALTPLLSAHAEDSPPKAVAAKTTAPPPAFDLRSVGGKSFVTEVRDQGICNSCTAYAVVAAIESAIAVKQNTPAPQIHLSEEQLFSCAGPG